MNKTEYEFWNDVNKLESFVISNILVDIDFLNYIDLGELLTSPELTEDEYDHIVSVSSSKDFSKRLTNDTSVIYNIKNKKLFDNQDVILFMSPAFKDAYDLICNHIIMTETVKKKAVDDDTKVIVNINYDRLPNLTEVCKNRLTSELSYMFNSEVRLIRLSKLTDEEIFKFDAFYINRLEYFTNRLYDKLNESKFFTKYIFCNKTLPISKFEKNHENDIIERAIVGTEIVMDAVARFLFVGPFTIETTKV